METKLRKTTQDQERTQSDEFVQLIHFQLGSQDYALPVGRVKEVLRIVEITRLPELPNFVEGLINVRGDVIPVIDLQKRFRIGITKKELMTRIVIVKFENLRIGFMADKVSEILSLPQSAISKPSEKLIGIDKHYITSVAKLDDTLVIILESERIFTSAEIEKLEESVNTSE